MSDTKIFLVVAALMGAAGVALLAAGTHAAPGNTTVAGQMLLFHAPAVMAASQARRNGALHGLLGCVALVGLVAGVCVFSADLAMRGLGSGRLFPMAAPIGGSFVILSWLVLAIAALASPRRD